MGGTEVRNIAAFVDGFSGWFCVSHSACGNPLFFFGGGGIFYFKTQLAGLHSTITVVHITAHVDIDIRAMTVEWTKHGIKRKKKRKQKTLFHCLDSHHDELEKLFA